MTDEMAEMADAIEFRDKLHAILKGYGMTDEIARGLCSLEIARLLHETAIKVRREVESKKND